MKKVLVIIFALIAIVIRANAKESNFNALYCVKDNKVDTLYYNANLVAIEAGRRAKNLKVGLAMGGGACLVASVPLIASGTHSNNRTMCAYGFSLFGVGASSLVFSITIGTNK